MLRDFMFFHASGLGDGPPDVSQSKALLEFMGTHLQSQNKPFSQYLQTEIERFTSETDATYLAHDYLEQNNKPIYFREFVARARDVGLDYLGESEFFTMLGTDITDEAKIRLSTEIQDIVRLEQYFDFMNNRSFRMTLLVHQNTAISRQITEFSPCGFLRSPIQVFKVVKAQKRYHRIQIRNINPSPMALF
jgi:hypothetical protein